jgi:predicted phosphodiesterase
VDQPWQTRGGSPITGPEGDGARILLAGDTHGNLPWITTLARLAARHRCQGVVVLGDFGFWPDPAHRNQAGEPLLNDGWITAVAEAMARQGQWLRVIDGNHDFHPAVLAAYPPDEDGIAVIRDGLMDWATRGSRWAWCGVRFGALGGAFSIDRAFRRPGLSWWPTETITDAEVERLGRAPLDVLLTHDAPEGVNVEGVDIWTTKDDPTSTANRWRVEYARRATGAQLLCHGHYHLRYSASMAGPPTRVEGLAADLQGNGEAWGVLELPSLSFTDGAHLEAARMRQAAKRG